MFGRTGVPTKRAPTIVAEIFLHTGNNGRPPSEMNKSDSGDQKMRPIFKEN